MEKVTSKKVLITGHRGLIGRHLAPILTRFGYQVIGLDIADSADICVVSDITQSIEDCCGVIHLAAVSRVVWGEQNPQKCWQTNAIASEQLLQQALKGKAKPWVILASSREVYGESSLCPVHEDFPLLPVNIYGEAKLAMEQASLAVRDAGLNE